jgi:iron complex outermembrane recepter protein
MQTPTQIRLFTTKADYEQKVGKGKLAIGAKYSNVETGNVFDFFDVIDDREILNTNRSNAFDYREEILATYVNFNQQIKKINLQVGLRAEQTRSLGELTSQQANNNNVKRLYTNLFPSGGLSFNQNANSSWGVSYSRRIERPNYQSLNPFEYQLNELSIVKGNPFLQPQYVNTLKVSNTYKYRLNTAVSYSRVGDFFAEVTDTLGTTRNFMQTQNIATQHILNANVSLPFNVKKWWSVYLSLDAFRSSFESTNSKFVPLTANALSFYGQNTFTLSRGFSVEASGWYASPSIWGGTYRTRHQGAFNVAVQKAVFNKKVNVQLSANDIFFTSPWKGTSQFGDLKINGSGGWESRVVRLNLSYKFGNKNVKSARQRGTSLDDAKARIQ